MLVLKCQSSNNRLLHVLQPRFYSFFSCHSCHATSENFHPPGLSVLLSLFLRGSLSTLNCRLSTDLRLQDSYATVALRP